MKVTLHNQTGGHDGAASGGDYGPFSYLVCSRNCTWTEISRVDNTTSGGGRLSWINRDMTREIEVSIPEGGYAFLVKRVWSRSAPDTQTIIPLGDTTMGQWPVDDWKVVRNQLLLDCRSKGQALGRAVLEFVNQRYGEECRAWYAASRAFIQSDERRAEEFLSALGLTGEFELSSPAINEYWMAEGLHRDHVDQDQMPYVVVPA